MQFLFYATLSQANAAGLLIGCVVYWLKYMKQMPHPHPVQIILLVVDIVFLIPVTIAVGGLFWYQFSCILENLTTIDEYIVERRMRSARRSGRTYEWPYDMGWRRNLVNFFGNSVGQWLIPGSGPFREGLQFEKKGENNEKMNSSKASDLIKTE